MLASQVNKLKERFALESVVLIGDPGMITKARLTHTVMPAGLDWITALRALAIRSLVEAGTIQLSLSDQRDLARSPRPTIWASAWWSAAIHRSLRNVRADATFTLYPQLTTVQARALQLVGVSIQLVVSKPPH